MLSLNWRSAAAAIGLLLCGPLATPAAAQDYPSGPVKFITQLGPGGGTDPAMRIVIDQLGRMWGQQTLLVNQPGAGGAIAARAVTAAPADGHTVYMAIASTWTVLPELQPALAGAVNDYVPIGFVGEVPLAIAASPTANLSTLPELVAHSKQQAGGVNIAVPNRGGVTHLAIELLRMRTDAALIDVYYPGSAQALSDVLSGRVPYIIDGLAGPVASGQLKLLAVTASSRVATRPGTATVAEMLPGFAATGWFALVAPRGTPPAIVKKLSDDLRTALAMPEVQQKFTDLSISTRTMSPEALGDFIRSEQQLWQPVVKRLRLATP